MNFSLHDRLIANLSQRLSGCLPGRSSRQMFSPPLSYGRQNGPAACDARPAAVIALLYPKDGQLFVALTLRPDHLPEHAGQISFPGGLTEKGETSRQAALRELREELGVEAAEVQILGQMSDIYVFVSNYWVTPWLAVCKQRPEFIPNPDEVAQVVEVPLAVLMDKKNYGRHRVNHRCLSFEAPHIQFQSHRIWGATSMMLGELIALVRESGPT